MLVMLGLFAAGIALWAWSLPTGMREGTSADQHTSTVPVASVEHTSTALPADMEGQSTTTPQPAKEPSPTPVAPPPPEIAIAWQPSHQGDTGYRGWKEYEVCGDIARRAIGLLPEYEHVLAWETNMGLTGSNNYTPDRGPTNTPAFDSEIAMSNAAGATLFVSIHNDGGAPSGILAMCMPGDAAGRAACETLADALVSATGLPDRGIREARLYSLEARNTAPIKCLLEIGDNEADRAYLENPANREVIARGLAQGVRALELSALD